MSFTRLTNLNCLTSNRLRSFFKTQSSSMCQHEQSDRTELMIKKEIFDEIPEGSRNKEAFTKALGLFIKMNVRRVGHTEFIYAALKKMKEFGVHRDLDVYKALLDVFPKGKMIPKNFIQVEGMHYPKQQQCCIDVLDEMEWNRVFPDKELYTIVKNAFGEWTHAMRKMKRMMYWMPKFKNADPYPMPSELSDSHLEMARVVMTRICRDPANILSTFHTESLADSDESTWLVSGQSPMQQQLLDRHDEKDTLYVNGPYTVWLRHNLFHYFTLTSERNVGSEFSDLSLFESPTADQWANWKTKYNSERPDHQCALENVPSVHEQDDATLLGVVISGSGSKESLACWITFLQQSNAKLGVTPVVFRLKSDNEKDIVHAKEKTNHGNESLAKV